jgi:Leucine-rich repeat (LRR) protein
LNLGLIPQSIGNLRQLKTLELSDNKLSGLIPQTISNMSSLEEISLSNNKFSGTSNSRPNILYHIINLFVFYY